MAGKAAGGGLTLKQQNFAQAYIRLGNATEAYLEAYNCHSRSAATHHGSLILKRPEVQAVINQAKAKSVEVASITVHSIVAEQEHAMEMARASGNSVAYAAASMNKAKLLGMLIERQAVLTAKVDMTELAPDLSLVWGKAKLKLLPHAVTPIEPVIEIASDYKDIED